MARYTERPQNVVTLGCALQEGVWDLLLHVSELGPSLLRTASLPIAATLS